MKAFNCQATLKKDFDVKIAKTIQMRMAVLSHASTLADVPVIPPVRCHQLSQDRDEQFAVSLSKKLRLVFVPNHEPIPRASDGGIDKASVTAIKIIEVIDYH